MIKLSNHDAKERDIIRDFFLFRNLSEPELSRALAMSEYEVKEYSAREEVYSPADFSRAIGLILHGSLSVVKKGKNHNTLLNTLGPADSFGAAGIFGGEDKYPTAVTAKTQVKIAFISAERLEALLRKFPEISVNYIRFLSEKIRFLNDKIDSFTKPSVREKTAKLIIGSAKAQGSNTISLKNMKKTADSIGTSRPSFYRVLEELAGEGIIKYESGTLTILDMERLIKIQ